jgi:hypothetical protein
MTATVARVGDQGFPVEVLFTFDVPLEDASLRWLWWDWDQDVYRTFDLPAVGAVEHIVGPF